MGEQLTPMLDRYAAMKRKMDADTLLLFRLGDFYELFMDDARVAAPLLGLTLTHRAGQPMCGIPHHALDTYLAKLVRLGRKAAICDQMEDPKKVKKGKMVLREVTRIVTPGTVTEETMLADDLHNYLAAAAPVRGGAGGWALAVLELSTGDFFCESPPDRAALVEALRRLAPGEALVPDRGDRGPGAPPPPAEDAVLSAALAEAGVRCATPVDEWYFDPAASHEYLCSHFRVASLDGFGVEGDPAACAAAGALLRRVHDDLHRDIGHVRALRRRAASGFLALDATSAAHLNLFPDKGSAARGASLCEVLDATRTPMGARLLRDWIARPLDDLPGVEARLGALDALLAGRAQLSPLREALGGVRDLARAISRVSLGRGGPRDVAGIAASLKAVPALRELLARVPASSALLARTAEELRPLPELTDEIDRTLADEPPASAADGGAIRRGFSPALDELRDAQSDGRRWVAEYQAAEAERTGIKKLKVGYNRVFGYYIEVTASQLSLVPEDYQRKQTIAGGERFVTPALKEREELIATAESRSLELEQGLFEELRAHVVARTAEIQSVSDALARLDVLCSLADRALAFGYVRPQVDDGPSIEIRGGRHPIVEQLPGAERFVPNDALLGGPGRQIVVITGPNMAGKSTYIRQVALIVVMAQIGSYVPADSARIGLVDRVFTRVGASDDLARGRSTFLVEMQETANILNNATARSLVVLDEIGRGTSTFDGISIAWAVAEYLHDEPRVKARTLFATHYHELTDLALSKPGVANCSVLVRERGDGIVFLRRIVDGPADKSYGIAVAKLAGMPAPVLDRARQILSNLEKDEIAEDGRPAIVSPRGSAPKVRKPVDNRQLLLGI